MEPTSSPPKLLETIAGLLLPRTVREQVLGDLHERYIPGPLLSRRLNTDSAYRVSRKPWEVQFSSCLEQKKPLMTSHS